eukprot:gnl/Trimastix_PCT/4400.p1 GENE.gnl/Trimastix_PCT/4400~~gnl/Trimastix_PCT/4400.p1  ORF type:complete len:246 (+),score=35.43 gnl/Trimastix_PCT/4400:97-834(+)
MQQTQPETITLFDHLRTLAPKSFQGKRVLDCGCGQGFIASHLSELGAISVHGVDYAEGQITKAKRFESQEKHITFAQASAHELPLEDSSVDTVLFSRSFTGMAPDLAVQALREVHRILSPQGHVIFYDFVSGAEDPFQPFMDTYFPDFSEIWKPEDIQRTAYYITHPGPGWTHVQTENLAIDNAFIDAQTLVEEMRTMGADDMADRMLADLDRVTETMKRQAKFEDEKGWHLISEMYMTIQRRSG